MVFYNSGLNFRICSSNSFTFLLLIYLLDFCHTFYLPCFESVNFMKVCGFNSEYKESISHVLQQQLHKHFIDTAVDLCDRNAINNIEKYFLWNTIPPFTGHDVCIQSAKILVSRNQKEVTYFFIYRGRSSVSAEYVNVGTKRENVPVLADFALILPFVFHSESLKKIHLFSLSLQVCGINLQNY